MTIDIKITETKSYEAFCIENLETAKEELENWLTVQFQKTRHLKLNSVEVFEDKVVIIHTHSGFPNMTVKTTLHPFEIIHVYNEDIKLLDLNNK